jgi:hypothetical protein
MAMASMLRLTLNVNSNVPEHGNGISERITVEKDDFFV